MTKTRGMFPGEYMKASLVKVWPDDDLGDKPPISGRPREAVTSTHWKETRPEFYVAVTRRNDLDWHVEVLKATPITDGQIPDEVMERLISQRKAIMDDQKSENAKLAAERRRLNNNV